MNTLAPSLFRTLRRYAGKLQTMRNDRHTRRLIQALPASTRKDIGWSDLHQDQRDRH